MANHNAWDVARSRKMGVVGVNAQPVQGINVDPLMPESVQEISAPTTQGANSKLTPSSAPPSTPAGRRSPEPLKLNVVAVVTFWPTESVRIPPPTWPPT